MDDFFNYFNNREDTTWQIILPDLSIGSVSTIRQTLDHKEFWFIETETGGRGCVAKDQIQAILEEVKVPDRLPKDFVPKAENTFDVVDPE